MKCSSRSTVSFSSRVAVGVWLAGVLVAPAGEVLASAAVDDAALRIEEAIGEAVRGRLGESAAVSVTIGHVQLIEGEFTALEARPAPGARLARPTRFTLFQQGADPSGDVTRVGYAVAETHVAIEHVRASRPIARGTVLVADDLVTSDGDVGSVLMRPLPTHRDLVGAMASRDLRSGELVTSTAVTLPQLVRARQSVVVIVQVGSAIVSGHATAMENGVLGDVISLVNEQSGRRLRGRVVALGEVEVVQ